MNERHRRAAICALALTAAGRTQEPGTQPTVPPQAALAPAPEYVFESRYGDSLENEDYREEFAYGGFRFRWPALGVEVRGRNALLLSDRSAVRGELQTRRDGEGPPRRGIAAPEPRRRLTVDVLRDRLERLLSALGRAPQPQREFSPRLFDALRYLYFEGGIVVLRDGVEVVRCERLWLSPLDDRLVVEDAELRYASTVGGGDQLLTIRGPRLEKQGPRWSGRDLTVTTCEAGQPHLAVASGELELVEREGQFEIWSRGNRLQVSGTALVPLPDAHFFSGEQSSIPIRGANAGFSNREGARVHVDLGMPIQDVGGSVHEWLTGRPAHEFRGEWQLGLGWTELRGYPLDGALEYRGADLYQGRTEFFYMDDGGPNLREVVDDLGGNRIVDRNRNLVRSQNRVFLGAESHLDVSAFHAGDAAVYPEFFRGDYRNTELPETSVYLHHANDNVLVTVDGRFQSDSFSYRDNRSLAPFFVEELPVATVHWLAQPIATLPWDTPIVLDTATEVGLRRRASNDGAAPGFAADRTLRADQVAELSAPFALGPLQLRPFGEARFTHYDRAVDGDAADRVSLAAGLRAGTRLSRTFHWVDEFGHEQGLRHVISPLVTFADRFRVDGDPAEFRRFDEVDALTEQNLVRVELRNQLQRMTTPGPGAEAAGTTRDVVFADVAQDFWPNAGRDNGGERLGLFYYDLQVRSEPAWWPIETLALGIAGDHDWDTGLRTFDAEVQFGKVLGLDWSLDYRRDAVVDAAAGVGAHAQLLGRWDVYGGFSYDFDRSEVLHYTAGLRRDDHDWSMIVGLDYDPFEDVVSFHLDFEPHLFGRPSARTRNWFGPAVDPELTGAPAGR